MDLEGAKYCEYQVWKGTTHVDRCVRSDERVDKKERNERNERNVGFSLLSLLLLHGRISPCIYRIIWSITSQTRSACRRGHLAPRKDDGFNNMLLPILPERLELILRSVPRSVPIAGPIVEVVRREVLFV